MIYPRDFDTRLPEVDEVGAVQFSVIGDSATHCRVKTVRMRTRNCGIGLGLVK